MLTRLERLDALTRWLGRTAWSHYRGVLLGALVAAALGIASLPGLRLHFDAAELLPRDDPAAETYRRHQRLFGESSPLVIQLVRGPSEPAAFDDFTERFAEGLGSVEELTGVTWRLYDLEADGTIERLRAAILDPATPDPGEWSDRFSAYGVERQLRRLRRRLLSTEDATLRGWMAEDPLDLRLLLYETDRRRSASGSIPVVLSRYFDAPDGAWRLLFAQPDRPSADAEYCLKLRRRVDELATALRTEVPGTAAIGLRYGGLHGAVAESQELLMRDMALMTGVAFALIGLILWLSLRRWRFVFIAIMPLVVSLCLFLGFVRWFFNPIYSHNIGVGAAILGLGLDVSLHLTARYLLVRREISGSAAVEEVLARAGLPILIGVSTTALAFLALLVTRDPALTQFGLLMAVGLLLTLVVALLLFPALVRWLTPGEDEASAKEASVRLVPLAGVERLGRRPLLVAIVWLAVLAISIQATRGFSFDMRLSLFFARDLEAFDIGEDLAEIYGTSFSQTMEVGLTAPTLAAALEAQHQLDRRLAELVEEGTIGGFAGSSMYLPSPSSVAAQEEGIELLRDRIGETAPELAELLAAAGLREPPSLDRYASLLTGLWPTDLDSVARRYDLERAPGPLRGLAASDSGGVHLKTIVWPPPRPGTGELDLAHDQLAERLSEIDVTGAETAVTGEMLLFDRNNRALLRDIVKVSTTAVVLVLLAAALFFRRPLPTALVVIPVAVAMPLTLAVAVWIGLPLPPVAVCFLAVVLGIGIDDGVHLVTEATRGRDVWRIVRETGPVLFLTSVSTACGFGALAISHHGALAALGQIVAIGVLVCWLTTIGLLAPLVAWLQSRGHLAGGSERPHHQA